MRPLGWMSTCLSGPDPELTNLWGTPAGATTIWPALTSIVSSPTVKVALALKRHEDLLVGMGVQHRSTAGRAVDQEE